MQFTALLASALAVAVVAAVPQDAPTYSNSTTNVGPSSNGTSTSGSGSASPTGSSSGSKTSAGFTPESGAGKTAYSSAAMGLVLAGGVALIL